MSVKCFFLEDTGRDRVSLRRYEGVPEGQPKCPGMGYHNAKIFLRETESGKEANREPSEEERGQHTWPTKCDACDHIFTEGAAMQFSPDSIFRRADTGEEMLREDAPPGAMWFAPWYDDNIKPQLEHCLVVKLPDGHEWIVDSQASNCTIPEDHHQEKHHCWVITGTLPNITVGKGGVTCAAGAGSIQTPNWHGFLTAGELVG